MAGGGWARLDEAWLGWAAARLGKAARGMASAGVARPDSDWRGEARQGEGSPSDLTKHYDSWYTTLDRGDRARGAPTPRHERSAHADGAGIGPRPDAPPRPRRADGRGRGPGHPAHGPVLARRGGRQRVLVARPVRAAVRPRARGTDVRGRSAATQAAVLLL